MDLLRIFKNSTVYPDSLMNGGSTKPSQSQLTIGQSGDRYNTLNTPLYCLSLRPQPTQRQRAEASPLIFCTTLLGLAAVAGAGARQPNQLSMSSAVTRLQSALGLSWDDTHHSDTGGNISEN